MKPEFNPYGVTTPDKYNQDDLDEFEAQKRATGDKFFEAVEMKEFKQARNA